MSKRKQQGDPRTTTPPSRASSSASRTAGRRARTRSWVLVGIALVCVLGMVAPGLLFASGTNTASTGTTATTAPTPTTPTPTTQRDAETTAPPSAMQCSSIVDGAPVPGRLGGCTGADGTGEPASFLSCPDGSLFVVVAGHVGRPGSVWKQAPEGATKEQLVAIGC